MTTLAALAIRQFLFASEPARAAADTGAMMAALPLLYTFAPRGEPHPVLVLPGLLASDASTLALRQWIAALGHPVAGWTLGRNCGPTPDVVSGLPAVLERMADRHGQPVTLIGWSLGGIFARKLALRQPDHVRQVISLGSPFRTGGRIVPAATAGERTYQRLSHQHSTQPLHPATAAVLAGPLPVPSTSVYSRWDGIVDWRDCLQDAGPLSENVPVRASHLGMGQHPAVLWLLADRLAQAPAAWRPYRAPSLFRRRGTTEWTG